MKTVGYARSSSNHQIDTLQLAALHAAGCTEIFEDACPGPRRDLPELANALATVGAADVVVVWRLDRIGSSLRHLFEIVQMLRDRGVILHSLTESLDTSTRSGQNIDLILGSVVDLQRELIRERTVAGLRAARSRSVHCGRRRALTSSQVELARLALTGPDASIAHVARQLRVGRATLYRELTAARTIVPLSAVDDASPAPQPAPTRP